MRNVSMMEDKLTSGSSNCHVFASHRRSPLGGRFEPAPSTTSAPHMSRAWSVALSLAILSFVATLRASCFPLDVFMKAASNAKRMTSVTRKVTAVFVMLPSQGMQPPTVR